MTYDPIGDIKKMILRARNSGDAYANAAVLATVDDKQRPSARMLLVKHIDQDGLVFYTNLDSRKARDLAANPNASLCFWWPQFMIQIRVDGVVEPVGDEEADTYFARRPRGSQIGAWASNQSRPLADRARLAQEVAALTKKFRGRPIPRPPHWSGFRIIPESIEIWRDRPDRLHDRQLFTRTGERWDKTLLYP